MKTIDNIIKELESLNLSTYPIERIKELITDFGHIGVIQLTLHPGKYIYRARLNKEGETFTKKSDLSYLPKDKNTVYKRGSTPNMTMFYGSIIPEEVNPGELTEVRVVGCFECIDFLRNTRLDGEQKLTFGKWIVTCDIPLIAIVYEESYINKSEYFREIYDGFQEFINHYPEHKDNTIKISEFLAKEFAKSQTENDYEYVISALFTERIVEKGLAGVVYPSVRTEGDGYNVAIHPSFVDTCLRLVAVGECTIYKKGGRTIVDNETVALLDEGQLEFSLNPVNAEYHMGKEKAIEELNK